tara:strand:- start:1350 stop:2498 length:1149 start_codon:yes stop_codon:yes gene_type:complete
MANWKKVIVSGSNAELLTVTASFFKGDGSALTGVVASSANALTAGSGLSAAGTYDGSVARTFTVNSGSLVAYYSGSIFGTVSGDVTITSAGVSAIGATKVTNAMLAGSIENNKLTNSTITIGSTSTALGATNTTIAGLVSVTSTTFVGALTGNASTVTTNANLTGDVTSTGNATTLATVASAGTTGGSTAIPVITINAKGLTTGITTAAVVAPAGTLSGATLASNVLASSLTSVGTLAGLTATGTAALATLTVSGDATVTGNLSVAGTASFTNTDNLNIKDKFILINSGSAALADSGWVTQYNAAGSGSAFYLEAASTGTYGRFAVAYDVIGTSTSLTPDEFVVTAKTTAIAPSADPTWGGSSNGSGNIHINSATGDVYIYS